VTAERKEQQMAEKTASMMADLTAETKVVLKAQRWAERLENLRAALWAFQLVARWVAYLDLTKVD
jgi:hypothetical protein